MLSILTLLVLPIETFAIVTKTTKSFEGQWSKFKFFIHPTSPGLYAVAFVDAELSTSHHLVTDERS